jgi:hypothetical protein
LRCGSDCGVGGAAPAIVWRQVEERRGDLGVDQLVRPHVFAGSADAARPGNRAEIEERLPADEAPRRAAIAAQVDRIGLAFSRAGSKIIAKNGAPLSPARFARYEGRTMVWPKRNTAPWNSIGINAVLVR